MKRILLTQGKYALVDDEDFEELNQFKWHAAKDENTFYAVRSVKNKGGQRTLRMHRVILNLKKSQLCDHINRDGLDNQRSNLRIASHTLNMLNQRIRKDNKSGFKGVFYRKEIKKWVARIGINSKRKHLGYFNTAQKASVAYQKAYFIRMKELT